MFKVSTKGDYGLLLMAALAEQYGTGFVPLKRIAEEKHLSLPYMSQIVIPLKRAKLIKSKEGVSGGYLLAREPRRITLMEILRALEGAIAPVRCMKKAKSCQCESNCSVQYTWKTASQLLTEFFEHKTLADLIPPQPPASHQRSNVIFFAS